MRGERRFGTLILLLSSLCFGSGCQGLGAYARDRGADLADLFVLETGYGLGLHVDAQGTDLIHPGLGYSQVQKVAFHGRDGYWTRDRDIGLPGSALLLIPAIRDGHWHRLGHWHVSSLELRGGQDSWLHRFDTSLGATLAFLQFRVGFSMGQFIDFLGGIAGLDLAGDDRGSPLEPSEDDGKEWFNGDAHVHISPPDTKRHVHNDLTETAKLAESEGSQWLMLTPHIWPSAGRSDVARHPLMQTLAGYAGPSLLPGWEYSRNRNPGHGLMVFRNVQDFQLMPGWNGDQMATYWLTELPKEKLFFAQAHPFSAPLNIPFVGISRADLSWFEQSSRSFSPRLNQPSWSTKMIDGVKHWEMLRRSKNRVELSTGSAPLAKVTFPTELFNKLNSGLKLGTLRKNKERWTSEWAPQVTAIFEKNKSLSRSVELAKNRVLSEFQDRSSGFDGHLVIRCAIGSLELRLTRKAQSKLAVIELGVPNSFMEPLPRAVFERMDKEFDGLEVYNHTVHLAELGLGVPKEDRHITKAFAKLDKAVARRRIPLTPLGGADNHRELMPQTTWLLSASDKAEDLFDALKAGRTVVGSNETCDFSARSDDNGAWRSIGARLRAKKTVTLRWRGEARLIIDGKEWGTAKGGLTFRLTKDFHSFRIIQGLSHSGYIVVSRDQ